MERILIQLFYFQTLHERVIEEQKEYQQYLEKLAHTAKSDYNYLAPEADRYFKVFIFLLEADKYPKVFI